MSALDETTASTGNTACMPGVSRSTLLLRRLPTGGVVVFCVVLLCIAMTMRDYGLTTDEPIYILNTHRVMAWFSDLIQQGPTQAFKRDRLRKGFYVARPDNKNLPANTLISAAGYVTVGRFDSRPSAYRWGNIIVFALTCGVVYQWLARELSPAAGIVGVLALAGMPRLFAHAQLLNIDTLVGCFWVLASWALYYSRGRWGRSFLFGLLCGIGLMTKPTFWFAVPVWVVWGLLYRPKELWRAAICLAVVAPLTALFLIPLWWSDPIGGFLGYLDMLRHDENGWQIDAYYFGEVYQMTGLPPVPWHSVIVLPLVTTPIWIVAFAAGGFVKWIWRDRKNALAGLWVGSAIVLPLIVMLPSTPAHDGVRLYRVSFYFVALLAAYGFYAVSEKWLIRDSTQAHTKVFRSRCEFVAIALLTMITLWPLWRMHPGQLSYYNLLVGGLDGAAQPVELQTAQGKLRRPRFEIDYWWGAMNESAWESMQQQLPPDAKLWVFPEHFGLDRLKEWGHLRQDVQLVGPSEAEYLLIYGRLGRLMDPRSGGLGERFLHGEPLWELRIDNTRVATLFQF